MKILILCQYYYPDPFRITDVAENFVKQGHEVFVLAGEPSYERESWLKEGGKVDEVRNGVKVHRVKTVPRGKGIIRRVRNYYSYAINSKRYVKKLDKDFDVVFVYELSPIMMAEAAIKYKKKYGTKIVLYCLDLWPESLLVSRIKKNSLVYKYFHKVSKRIYSACDDIAITSELFRKYFVEEFNYSGEHIHYLPQYAEDLFQTETKNDLSERCEDKYVFVFAGNIGKLQSVETIIRAARILQNNNNISFKIIGDGVSLLDCKKEASGLNNVEFIGRKPVEEMPLYYSEASAMLVTMIDKDVVNYVMPGKVQSYMAASKPIIGAIGGETKLVVQSAQCGYCCDGEDYVALSNNIVRFIEDDIETRKQMAINAKKYYDDNFTKIIFYDRLFKVMKKEK